MTPPKASSCNGSMLLLLFIICVYVYCGPTDQSLRGNESGTLKRTNLDERSGWLHHERFRRESSGAVRKCSDSQCFGNKTTFFTSPSGCYCDEACYKIFSDCCPDYEKQCGRQQLLEDKTSVWKCVEFSEVEIWRCIMVGPTGVWMISKCPADWRFDELRTKCENNTLSFFGYPVEDFIPVVGVNHETYRNKHCAVCNGVENHISWQVRVFTYVIPPDEFDLDSKLKFIEDNGGRIESVLPVWGQPWRFCFGRNFKNKCSSTNHSLYKACVEGPVEVVGAEYYFKNRACAECNGWHNIDYYAISQICGGPAPPGPVPEGFSIVFNLRKASEISTVTGICPVGTVYDTTLKFCREGYIISSSGKLTNQFLILLWFKLSRGWIAIDSTVEYNFKSALICRFSLQDNQISKIIFHLQNHEPPPHDFVVATFRLTLTPFQSLLMANQHKSIINVTNQSTAFLELLNFTGNFTLSWEENVLSVIKLTSKRLSCYDEKKLQSHEYKIDKENGSLVVNKREKIFSLEDYTLIKEEGGNITLCRKLVLSDCNEGAFVPLNPDEYVVFPNSTVYHNATESVFNFGEYLISENKGTSNTSNTIQNSLLSSNSTISVCLPFKDTFTKTEYSTNTTSYALRILTLIGFSISIICIMLLLITYGLFQELRAVSGMNLMNLSLSFLLSHLIWLIGTSHFTGTKTCKVLAIFEHYLFQVSFVAMSVISYHSCYVFSQPFAGRVANKSWRRFIKYSAFVWLAPAIFVAICVTLDKTETFLVDYGTNCWLGTVNAKLYLFLLPLAILLLFNIVTFSHTALSLYRHEKERPRTLQERKQHLLISAKLATLVGFPWLIAFIGVLFPNVEAFEYLFVIFVCLQGLYIGMAFLFNKKTLKLYKDRWNIGSRGNASSYSPAQTFEMT